MTYILHGIGHRIITFYFHFKEQQWVDANCEEAAGEGTGTGTAGGKG